MDNGRIPSAVEPEIARKDGPPPVEVREPLPRCRVTPQRVAAFLPSSENTPNSTPISSEAGIAGMRALSGRLLAPVSGRVSGNLRTTTYFGLETRSAAVFRFTCSRLLPKDITGMKCSTT